MDAVAEAAESLVRDYGGVSAPTLDDLLALRPEVVIVATPHDLLAHTTKRALDAGAHVLVEKPGGLSSVQIASVRDAAAKADRLVKSVLTIGSIRRCTAWRARCTRAGMAS